MSNESPQDNNALRRLHTVLSESQDLHPDVMSEAQLQHYLQANKIDAKDSVKDFQKLLTRTEGQIRIQRAREKRIVIESLRKGVMQGSMAAVEEIKKKIEGMIAELSKSDIQQAQVYAREFEKSSPEDLASLAEDMLLLESDDVFEQQDQQDQSNR